LSFNLARLHSAAAQVIDEVASLVEELSIINYLSSLLACRAQRRKNYQLSIINYQLSIINYQLSITIHPPK